MSRRPEGRGKTMMSRRREFLARIFGCEFFGANLSRVFFERISCAFFLSEFLARISERISRADFLERISHANFLREFLARIPRGFLAEFARKLLHGFLRG